MTASHSASSMFTSIRSRRMPALLTRTSRPPKVSMAWSHEALGAVPVGDVVGVGDGLAPGGDDLVDDGLGRAGRRAGAVHGAAEVVDHDLGAVLGQEQGVLPPDAAAGAGHDADPSFAELGHAADLATGVGHGS